MIINLFNLDNNLVIKYVLGSKTEKPAETVEEG